MFDPLDSTRSCGISRVAQSYLLVVVWPLAKLFYPERSVGSALTLEDLADAIHEHGQTLAGDGRFRVWFLDRPRQELQLIATGDEAVIGRKSRHGQSQATLQAIAGLGAAAIVSITPASP